MGLPDHINKEELIEFPITDPMLIKFPSITFIVACEASRGYFLLDDDDKEKYFFMKN